MQLIKRISLLACFCLLAGFSMAQTKPLTGLVLDSLNRPIAYANVIAINQSTQKIAGFGISNNEGKFKVTLLEGPSYLIRVSFVGYRQFEQALNTWDSATPLLVRLKQSDTQLGLVEVVSEMPVTMKGDTLTYKTDAFTTGTERKLEDVLEKLVGSKLLCCYCSKPILVLYKNVREPFQWTLDRINNDLSHTKENTCIACLKCNLQRRLMDAKKFTFTKQLKINKV